jgi:hypothetical protein
VAEFQTLEEYKTVKGRIEIRPDAFMLSQLLDFLSFARLRSREFGQFKDVEVI